MHDWLDRLLIGRTAPGGASDRMALAIRVCLDEAVTNVIRHGRGDGAIDVSLRLSSAAAAATVVDAGPAFDPTAHTRAPGEARPADGGRGIVLIRAYASAIRYERRDATNRLRLRFVARHE